MPSPVRIKVYGLISLTRRGYLICQALGLVLMVVFLLVWAVFLRTPPSWPEPGAGRPVVAFWGLVQNYLPGILLLTVLLEAVETYFVLRRFRRAEAGPQAGGGQPNTKEP